MLFPFRNLLGEEWAYLVMQSIQPEENRFRLYIIKFKEEQGSFFVDLSRGRFAQSPRHKQEIFDEKDQFISFLK